MLAAVASATLNGAVGRPVSVEVHVSNGLPGFTIVGLPDAAVREARDRVRAAALSSGLPWPLRRVTVNLVPSGVRKGGAGLDLPIAVGLLVATGEISPTAAPERAHLTPEFRGAFPLHNDRSGGTMPLRSRRVIFVVSIGEVHQIQSSLRTSKWTLQARLS